MSPMIVTPPVAIHQSKEQESARAQEFEQEFELDVRISPVSITPQASCFYTHTSSARCCVSGTLPQCAGC